MKQKKGGNAMAENRNEETVAEDTQSEQLMDEVTDEVIENEAEDTKQETATEPADESTSDTKEDDKEESKTTKKKFKKDKKDKKDEKIEELTDRVQRQMAEFENFRKRTEKEKSQMYEIGAKSIIEKLLPVIDNFERAFAGKTEEEMAEPFADGMNKVYKQMTSMLEEAGVKAIEAVDTKFDPNFHNAVMHIDDDAVGENMVVEEFQKGYMYRDSVVRHSMVKVAN